MTTRIELLEIIANGENSRVEFKRDVLETQALARELVAFLNSDGGMVLLGVDDDKSIVGLTRERLEEWVMNVCRDKIRPPVIPSYEMITDIQPGRNIAVLSVPQGLAVHSLWHHNKHDYYIRVGSQSREPSPEELSRLFQRRSMLRAELQPISGSKFNDLDLRRLKNYFKNIRQQSIPDEVDEAFWRTLLNSTEIMDGELVNTGGMLLFGANPNHYLSQAGIEAAAFEGADKDYAAKERMTIRGPMVPLIQQNGELFENGLVEQAVNFVRRNTPVTANLVDGSRRVERRTYPDKVIREAVVNALIHRDYLLWNTDIELVVYKGRCEIISPGKLPNGITPESMRAGVRVARNQMLREMMRDYGYLEGMGMGVPRIIVRGMKEHNNTEPDFIEDGERFVVRLHTKPNSRNS